jgi:hypothetical protein
MLLLAYLFGLSAADRVVEARRAHFVEEKFLRHSADPVPSGPPAEIIAELEYRKVGCWIPTTFDHKFEDTEPAVAMTVDSCFIFCKENRVEFVDFLGMYFGITKGDKCWCASTYAGDEKADACTTPCSGGGPGCGGAEASDIYFMYERDATPLDTVPEVLDLVKEVAPETTAQTGSAAGNLAKKLPLTAQHADFNGDGVLDAHEITHAFHARFYVIHEGSTCGRGDPQKVSGRETMVASLTDCQMTCILARACGGFTFDTSLRQCAFVGDFDSGATESGDQYACYARAPA